MSQHLRRAILTAVLILPTLLRAADFVDPAPPTVSAIKPTPAADPVEHPALKFHAPPKPLAKDAVITDWPGFFGAAQSPISAETRLLKAFPARPPLVWESAKGAGYSGPAILGDRLVLFHRLKDESVIECLHRETGRRFWRIAYSTAYEDRYGWSNGPRTSPVIDPKSGLVFTLGADGHLHAIDLATGQIAWQRDLLAEFKLKPNFFGVGATPLIEGSDLIINIGAKNACVVAFDLRSGKARWAAPAPQNWGPSYAAGVAATIHAKRRVFFFVGGESRPATGGLLCINPVDGAVDFSFPWRGKRFESVNASASLILHNKVFISECYGQGGAMLELVLDNNKLVPRQLWSNENFGTHFMTALPLGDFLYGVHGHGPSDAPLVCVDLKSGKEKWSLEPDLSETITLHTGGQRRFNLSTCLSHLLWADGKTICLTEWGHLLFLDLSERGPTITSRTLLFFSRETWTPPVLSRGLLYICQNQSDRITAAPPRILCYDLRAEK